MSSGEDPGTFHDEAVPIAPNAELGAEQGGTPVGPPANQPAAPESDQQAREQTGRRGRHGQEAPNMLPGRERRRFGFERLLVRLIATCGIVGIGVALGAILASSKTQGWIIGLVVAIVSVVLSGILWSSRQL